MAKSKLILRETFQNPVGPARQGALARKLEAYLRATLAGGDR